MKKNKLITQIKSNKGFSGIEITVALVVLMIFVPLIVMIFTNIYLSYTNSRRNAEATAYATQIMEQIEKMYYADVTSAKLSNVIEQMNIPKGYGIQLEVNSYNEDDETKEDLVKTVIVNINYKVGKQTQSIRFETVKAKEILITPNKPKLSKGMVPVKYVVTDRNTNEGYWQITAEDDPTWYNYTNKRWANVMFQNGLKAEGGITVNDSNRKSLIGKKIESYSSISVWIPRYAYQTQNESYDVTEANNNIVFLYNTTNNYINAEGNMAEITAMEGYSLHSAFQANDTGLWFEVYESDEENVQNTLKELNLDNLQNNLIGAMAHLLYSRYGKITNIIANKVI